MREDEQGEIGKILKATQHARAAFFAFDAAYFASAIRSTNWLIDTFVQNTGGFVQEKCCSGFRFVGVAVRIDQRTSRRS